MNTYTATTGLSNARWFRAVKHTKKTASPIPIWWSFFHIFNRKVALWGSIAFKILEKTWNQLL